MPGNSFGITFAVAPPRQDDSRPILPPRPTGRMQTEPSRSIIVAATLWVASGPLLAACAKRSPVERYSPLLRASRAIEDLRIKNEMVIIDLPGHQAARAELGCDRELVMNDDTWQVKKL